MRCSIWQDDLVHIQWEYQGKRTLLVPNQTDEKNWSRRTDGNKFDQQIKWGVAVLSLVIVHPWRILTYGRHHLYIIFPLRPAKAMFASVDMRCAMSCQPQRAGLGCAAFHRALIPSILYSVYSRDSKSQILQSMVPLKSNSNCIWQVGFGVSSFLIWRMCSPKDSPDPSRPFQMPFKLTLHKILPRFSIEANPLQYLSIRAGIPRLSFVEAWAPRDGKRE